MAVFSFHCSSFRKSNLLLLDPSHLEPNYGPQNSSVSDQYGQNLQLIHKAHACSAQCGSDHTDLDLFHP